MSGNTLLWKSRWKSAIIELFFFFLLCMEIVTEKMIDQEKKDKEV